MMLRFVRYREKLFAKTAAGEFQFGEWSGLNEWRGGKRAHLMGGARQAAMHGRWLQLTANPDTFARGWHIALIPYIRPTN